MFATMFCSKYKNKFKKKHKHFVRRENAAYICAMCASRVRAVSAMKQRLELKRHRRCNVAVGALYGRCRDVNVCTR